MSMNRYVYLGLVNNLPIDKEVNYFLALVNEGHALLD